MSDIIRELINFVMKFAETSSDIWDWLTTNHKIGFDIFGFDFSFHINPLAMTGAVFITLLTLKMIKEYIPIA